MEKILIKNGLVVTKDSNNSILRNGIVYIEDNIIKLVDKIYQENKSDTKLAYITNKCIKKYMY